MGFAINRNKKWNVDIDILFVGYASHSVNSLYDKLELSPKQFVTLSLTTYLRHMKFLVSLILTQTIMPPLCKLYLTLDVV